MQGWTPRRTCVSPMDLAIWTSSNTLCCILSDDVPHIGQLDALDLNHLLLSFGEFSSWFLQQIKSQLTATPLRAVQKLNHYSASVGDDDVNSALLTHIDPDGDVASADQDLPLSLTARLDDTRPRSEEVTPLLHTRCVPTGYHELVDTLCIDNKWMPRDTTFLYRQTNDYHQRLLYVTNYTVTKRLEYTTIVPTAVNTRAFIHELRQLQFHTTAAPTPIASERVHQLAKGGSSSQLVATYARLDITRNVFQCLSDTSLSSTDAYLSSIAADVYIEMLQEEAIRLRHSHTAHYPGIRFFGMAFCTMNSTYDYQRMSRWTRFEDLFANDILVWLCHVGGNHWGFILASPGQLWISIFDPLYSPSDAHYSIWKGKRELIHRFMVDELTNNPHCARSLQHKGPRWAQRLASFDNWSEHPYGPYVQQMPQDTVNCGVISLHALTRLIYGLPLVFMTTPTNMENIRIQIGNSLATHVIHDGSSSLPTAAVLPLPYVPHPTPIVWASSLSSSSSLMVLLSRSPPFLSGENCLLWNL